MELTDSFRWFWLGQRTKKYTTWLKIYVRASAGPPGADTPNNKPCSTATCFIPQGRVSPAARLPGGTIGTIGRLGWAEPRCCALLTHTLRGPVHLPATNSRSGALTWSWPGSSPWRCGRTEGWVSSSLCPPWRRFISPPSAPARTSSCPANTWAGRRYGDAFKDWRTNNTLPPLEWKRGIPPLYFHKKMTQKTFRTYSHWESRMNVWYSGGHIYS